MTPGIVVTALLGFLIGVGVSLVAVLTSMENRDRKRVREVWNAHTETWEGHADTWERYAERWR